MFKNIFIPLAIRTFGFAAAILLPVCIGTRNINLLQIGSILFVSLISILLGHQLTRLMKLNSTSLSSSAVEIILGFSALSLLQLAFTIVFKLNPIASFNFVAIFTCAISVVNLYKLSKNDGLLTRNKIENDTVDIFIFLFISMLTTIWCRDLINSFREAQVSGIMYAWPDIFLHSTQVTSLKNYALTSTNSFYLAGTQQPLYHVASYVIPSFYANLTSEPTLAVTAYFWVPVGIVLMGIGAYSFGCAMSGRLTGFLSVTAIFSLPDASMYGLKNGFFGFHWLLQVSPGSGYALALVLVALALIVRGVIEKKQHFLVYGLLITISSAAFRVQITAPAIIMLTILMLLFWKPKQQWHRGLTVFIMTASVLTLMLIFETIDLAPHFFSGRYIASTFFDVVHGMSMSSFEAAYVNDLVSYPDFVKWIWGYGLYLLASLGLVLPVVLILVQIKKPTERDLIYSIPSVLMISCFIVILFVPVALDGDVTNFGQRQFLLLYTVFVVFMVWLLCELDKCKILILGLSKRARLVLISLTIFAASIVPWVCGKNIQQPTLRADWAQNITRTKIPVGLFEAAKYIKTHSDIRDVVLSSSLDPLATVVSLTERSAFISREAIYRNESQWVGKIFSSRKEDFNNLKDMHNYNYLIHFARKNRVHWFLKYPNDMPKWTNQIVKCRAFESGGFEVYDLRASKCY